MLHSISCHYHVHFQKVQINSQPKVHALRNFKLLTQPTLYLIFKINTLSLHPLLNPIIHPPLPEGGRCEFCMDATYGANWQWSDGTFWARFDYLYDCRCTFAWRSRGWGDEVELQTEDR